MARPAMDRLKRLCKVLGSNYQERLDELGIAAGHKEMDEKTSKALEQTIGELEKAKEARFSELQALGLKLRDLWKFHNTGPENILEFAEAFACIDAESANELTNEKSLSMELINKATEEINILEASMVAKQKKIYLGKKQKLLKLLEETHMVPADMKFDPKKKESDFPKAISDLKILIKQVKVQILERKDIVMRIELLQHPVNNSLSVKTSERLLRSLKNLVLLEDTFPFDGKDVKVVVNAIEDEMTPASTRPALPVKKRMSARLTELRDKKESNADLPPPPYPSRVRDGNRERRKGVWGKESKR
ncbi:hypothetical protein CFC21_008463 [Triticum aestivum]|uniref:Uncharacterized protein n=3 Tax=Triticum aestivum TaxID=4565 RepID=A0A9R1ISL8_WHEAT|nr:hypothetical protein CFC21_008463 [Triticum aestivum]